MKPQHTILTQPTASAQPAGSPGAGRHSVPYLKTDGFWYYIDETDTEQPLYKPQHGRLVKDTNNVIWNGTTENVVIAQTWQQVPANTQHLTFSATGVAISADAVGRVALLRCRLDGDYQGNNRLEVRNFIRDGANNAIVEANSYAARSGTVDDGGVTVTYEHIVTGVANDDTFNIAAVFNRDGTSTNDYVANPNASYFSVILL